jgi:hypothetical protein
LPRLSGARKLLARWCIIGPYGRELTNDAEACNGVEELPGKPHEGEACNGCGLCCAVALCPLAVEFLDEAAAPCPAMEFSDGRFWCGLLRHPSRYFGTPGFSDRLIRPMIEAALDIGGGCDASD